MSRILPSGEYDFEPVRGLPERPPEDERVLWQGSPSWKPMAIRAFHVRKVAIYFAILAAWRTVSGFHDGETAAQVAVGVAGMLPIMVVGLGLLAGLAYGYARTTIFTITSKRVVLRFGLALTLSLNLPFSRIKAADLRMFPDGSGDIAIRLGQGDRIAYAHLWPFARPWRMTHPQPMLRGLAKAEGVADILVAAIQGQPVPAWVEDDHRMRAPDMVPAAAE